MVGVLFEGGLMEGGGGGNKFRPKGRNFVHIFIKIVRLSNVEALSSLLIKNMKILIKII